MFYFSNLVLDSRMSCVLLFAAPPESDLRDCSTESVIAHSWIPVLALPLGDSETPGNLCHPSAPRTPPFAKGGDLPAPQDYPEGEMREHEMPTGRMARTKKGECLPSL